MHTCVSCMTCYLALKWFLPGTNCNMLALLCWEKCSESPNLQNHNKKVLKNRLWGGGEYDFFFSRLRSVTDRNVILMIGMIRRTKCENSLSLDKCKYPGSVKTYKVSFSSERKHGKWLGKTSPLTLFCDPRSFFKMVLRPLKTFPSLQ